jgi:hypothetical protein
MTRSRTFLRSGIESMDENPESKSAKSSRGLPNICIAVFCVIPMQIKSCNLLLSSYPLSMIAQYGPVALPTCHLDYP